MRERERERKRERSEKGGKKGMCGGVIDIRREKRMNEHDKERLCLKDFKRE